MINYKILTESKFDITDKDGNNYRLTITKDECPSDPRTWYNVGKMVGIGDRYNIGDDDVDDLTTLRGILIDVGYAENKVWEMSPRELCWTVATLDPDKGENVVAFPLYLCDHGGLSISTSPTSKWDSWFAGVIFVTKGEYEAKIYENICWKDEAKSILLGEIRAYDQYLCGDVYKYTLCEALNVIKTRSNGEIVERTIDFESEVIDELNDIYLPTFEEIVEWLPFEAKNIVQVG